jgi:hypothetical protein
MSRRPVNALAAFGLLATVGLLAASCATNNKSIFVQQVQYRTPGTCVVKNDPTQDYESGGTLDLALNQSYEATALVASQLLNTGNTATNTVDTDTVILQGADVHLDTVPSGILGSGQTDFSITPVNGTVYSTTSTTPSYGLASVNIIPPQIGATLAKYFLSGSTPAISKGSVQVVATFKVYGQTLGNDAVESAPFSFPVTVCYGCTIQVSGVATDTTTGKKVCAAASSSSGSTSTALPCVAGTDGPTPCEQCPGYAVCQICSGDGDCSAFGASAKCDTAVGRCY